MRRVVDVPESLDGLRVAVYSRISDDKYDTDAGVGRQAKDGRQRAERGGAAEIIDFIENDTSAFKQRKVTITDEYGNEREAWRVIRPVWNRMMTGLRQGELDAVVAYDLDRLLRQPRDLEDAIETAERYGIRWESVTQGNMNLNDAYGQMICRTIASAKNLESKDKSRRGARKHLDRVERGLPNWPHRPFGHQKDVTVLANGDRLYGPNHGMMHPKEGPAIQEAANAILKGATLTQIAKRWNADGLRTEAAGTTRKGKVQSGEWAAASLSKLMRSPRLAGLLEHNGEVTGRGNFEAILSEPTWRSLARALDARVHEGNKGAKGRGNRGGGKLSSELTGIMRCGKPECGRLVHVQTFDRLAEDGNETDATTFDAESWEHREYAGKGRWVAVPDESALTYAVNDRNETVVLVRYYRCPRGHVSIPADFADGIVFRRITEHMRETARTSFVPQHQGTDLEPLIERERDVRERMAQLGEMFGKISNDAFMAADLKLQTELKEIEREMREARVSGPWEHFDLEALAEQWDNLDLGVRRKVLTEACASVTLNLRQGGRGGQANVSTDMIRIEWSERWNFS